MDLDKVSPEARKLLAPWEGGKQFSNPLSVLSRKVDKIMATLDQVAADETAIKTGLTSVISFISGLEAKLAAALANTKLSPSDQAKVDAIFADAELIKGTVNSIFNPPAPTPAS